MLFLYFYNELYAVQPWIKHFVPPVIFNGQRWTDVTIDAAATMTRFIVRRLLLSIPTLFGVLVVAFLLLYVAPGDPVEVDGRRARRQRDHRAAARAAASRRSAPPALRALRAAAPSREISATRTSRTGRSRRTSASVFQRRCSSPAPRCCSRRVLGVTLGVLSARRPGGLADRFALGVAYLGISFPVYWVGLLLILLFAVTLHWLPPSGYGGLRFLVLPALTLGMRSIAFLARMTRSAMLDALGADFIRTARAKGLGEWAVTAQARAAQRAHSGHHRARARLRVLPHRQHSHRDDLLLARTSAATS